MITLLLQMCCCVLASLMMPNLLLSGVSRPVQQQSVTTPTYPSALGPDGPSLPRSALAEHDRRPNETQAHTAAATANPPQQTLQGV